MRHGDCVLVTLVVVVPPMAGCAAPIAMTGGAGVSGSSGGGYSSGRGDGCTPGNTSTACLSLTLEPYLISDDFNAGPTLHDLLTSGGFEDAFAGEEGAMAADTATNDLGAGAPEDLGIGLPNDLGAGLLNDFAGGLSGDLEAVVLNDLGPNSITGAGSTIDPVTSPPSGADSPQILFTDDAFAAALLESLQMDEVVNLVLEDQSDALLFTPSTFSASNDAADVPPDDNRSTIPEPALLLLLGTGLTTAAMRHRRRRVSASPFLL